MKRLKTITRAFNPAAIAILSLFLAIGAKAQTAQFVDPHDHIEEATAEHFQNSAAKLGAIGVALDVGFTPFILERKSQSRSTNWSVDIHSLEGGIEGTGLFTQSVLVEADDLFSERKRENLESSSESIAFESAYVIGELKFRSNSTFVLGKMNIIELANGQSQAAIALISGAKTEDLLIEEAYQLRDENLNQSIQLQLRSEPEVDEAADLFGYRELEPKKTKPLFLKAAYFGHFKNDIYLRNSAPSFIRAAYDPVLLFACIDNCIDATNALIVQYNAEEQAVEDLVLNASVGGLVNCAAISALGIPLGLGCSGVGLALIVVQVAVDAYYAGLRSAASQGCAACENQCYELWGLNSA